jgi:serine/threonine-protein kinase
MVERPALVRPGEMFEGFRIVRLLGRGGVGDVFEIAFEGTRMALKVVRVPQGCDEKQLQKILREGRIQGWIKHPNVVEVFETGVTRTGLVWIRMELLRGLTLRDVLHVKGTLSIALTVHYLRQMGIALQQCHRLGAVHRDTKPENLFVLPEHRIKLLDFGIAKLYGTGDTHEGGCLGTPPYMAPEQLRGRPVTPATDVYAVGLIAHEMLWGAHPFVEDLSSYDPHTLISRQFFEKPPSLAEVGVPEPMARVVARALSKEPEARQQDGLSFAEEVWAAWEQVQAAAPELDTLAGELSMEPRSVRAGSALRPASFEALSGAITRTKPKPLPPRGTAGRARTVRLPEAERDPSCVEALSAREDTAREGAAVEPGVSSPPAWSEVRCRAAVGARYDTVTLPAATPFQRRSSRGDAEQPPREPVVVVEPRGQAARDVRSMAPLDAPEVNVSSPRSSGRGGRGRGLRVTERVGMLLLGLVFGMVAGSMVSVHGEEARDQRAPEAQRPPAELPAPAPPAAASPPPEPLREASVKEPVSGRSFESPRERTPIERPAATGASPAARAASGVRSGAPASAKPSAPRGPRPEAAQPKTRRIFELIE